MNEFDIIARFFQRDVSSAEDVTLGIGDDAAVVRVPEGQELVLAMDTLVEAVHFPMNTAAEDIGWKALAVNLSDLAAMGAVPRWFTLSLTLPEVDEQWLENFSSGIFELASQYDAILIGGDLCRGPLAVTVQAHGLVAAGQAVMRSGARAGDLVYVSGTLGDAGYALTAMAKAADKEYFLRRLNRPQPRVAVGQALRGLASSAIDISDGLAGDLQHILDASRCGARIDVDKLPVSPALAQVTDSAEACRMALTAGDDYELCFTVAASRAAEVNKMAAETGVPLTVIGEIVPETTLKWLTPAGELTGYRAFEHFSGH